jgi:hypothetical protein
MLIISDCPGPVTLQPVQCMDAAHRLRRGAQLRRPCSCLPQNLRNTPLAGGEHQRERRGRGGGGGIGRSRRREGRIKCWQAPTRRGPTFFSKQVQTTPMSSRSALALCQSLTLCRPSSLSSLFAPHPAPLFFSKCGELKSGVVVHVLDMVCVCRCVGV